MATSSSSHTNGLQTEKILALLNPDGPLSHAIKGFEARSQQTEMMSNIIEAYHDDQIALIEAGTGTGKSLAYLLPALLWAAHTQERTVISTHTITLQEQLVNKDIPLLIQALNLPIKASLVKGMNNYVCLRKLSDAQSELRLFPSEESEEIEKIDAWKDHAHEGSRSELPFMPSSATWDRVGAESEACSYQDCPYYQQCYFFKARRQANEAQILVVNHHLLFADLFRRAETDNYANACILPVYKRIILDEAHHIEDIATEYFAARLNRLELMRTLGRLAADKSNRTQGKLPLLKEKLLLLFSKSPPREIGNLITRLTIDLPALRRHLNEVIHEAFEAIVDFTDQVLAQPANPEEGVASERKLRILPEHYQRPHWLETIMPRFQQLAISLKEYSQELRGLEADCTSLENDRLQEHTKGIRLDIQALVLRLESAASLLEQFIQPLRNPQKVRWVEAQKLKILNNVHLIEADLDISKSLSHFLFKKFSTIVLCSATLTTNRRFDFMRYRLGLQKDILIDRAITEHIYDSPFHYEKQALLAVPTDIPFPNDPDFNQVAYENIWAAIQASRGNAFVLFTSYTMLKNCYEALAKRLEMHRYTALKQGEGSRHQLLTQFKKTDHSVLFGTDSFWEGVDVVGDALRCVIIVKLPFKVPTEPIIQARVEAIIQNGGEPFFDYSVPHAIVKFKQGFGRLIRHKWDRGCIVCLDRRLISKGYGKLFLNSLPNCGHAFVPQASLQQTLSDFYRKTYHLVKSRSLN